MLGAHLSDALNPLVPERHIVEVEHLQAVLAAKGVRQCRRHLSSHGVVAQVKLQQAAPCTDTARSVKNMHRGLGPKSQLLLL